MLTNKRQELLLKLLKERGSATVTEIRELLDASESTVRRDITALDKEGRLIKVFGGAVAVKEDTVTAHEYTVAQKLDLNFEEKKQIARFAAALIEPEDFIYLDAGTTTGYMLDYIRENNVTFVTNAFSHAQRLVMMGRKVFLVGGELKASTEAIVGSQAMGMIQSYHFTKGFFGTNGVSRKSGCTTPDANEAMIKKIAMEQCRKRYVLCDSSKFDAVSSVTFAPFGRAEVITEKKVYGYEDCGNILIAE